VNEGLFVAAFFVFYLNTVVGRLAYAIGQSRGEKEYRDFQKSLLGVGTIWRVGDDGKLYRVKEGEKS
jgi:hypothetical protein